MDGGADSNGSPIQMMLQAMLKETSSHLMSEQQKMLQTLWNAWLEDQQIVKKTMSDELETIRQLQQEIKTLKTQTAEELKSMREQTAEDLKRMREQSAEQFRQMQEQTAEELKEMREQLDMVTKCLTANPAQTSPQPSYADIAHHQAGQATCKLFRRRYIRHRPRSAILGGVPSTRRE
jgi:uncharacterized protein YoxC